VSSRERGGAPLGAPPLFVASDLETGGAQALTDAPALAVVLGGGLSDGAPHPLTVTRARRAAGLAAARPTTGLILSGSRSGYEDPAPRRSEARLMADVIVAAGVEARRLALEDESRDTVGNAVLTAARYLRGIPPRPLALVTSPFHMPRALYIFSHVLGRSWTIEATPCEPVASDDERARLEPELMEQARELLEQTTPADLRAIATRLRERVPYYRAVDRIAPARL
jgi:uncharacterized SAM-binding protein YcdF (DUF218 family)